MIEGLKSPFANLLRPMVRPLVAAGIRPNHVTLAGLGLFIVAATMVFLGRWTLACVMVVFGAILDGIDGLLSREAAQQTAFGAILDSGVDRLTEIVLLLGTLGYYLSGSPVPAGPAAQQRVAGIAFCYTAVTMSLMVSYLRARCEGAGIACRSGLLQRPERIILLCIGLLLGPRGMVWMLAGLTLLATVTVMQRFIAAYRGATGIR